MDYKKAYEKMVQRARELHKGGNALTKQQMEIVCPELEKSEDERIRREMIEFLNQYKEDGLRGVDITPWITYLEKQKVNTDGDFARGYDCGYQCCLNSHGAEYLEKQKEQTPKEDKDAIEPTPKQDYSGLTDLERAIHRGFLCAGVENVPVEIIKETAQDCLAHIEQKPAEWSEEDERIQGHIIDVLTYYAENHSALTVAFIKRDIDWLKSLPMGCPKKTE